MAESDIEWTTKLIVGRVEPARIDETPDGTAFIGANTSADPTPTPIGGGFLWVAADGSLHYKGPNGTNTQIAAP